MTKKWLPIVLTMVMLAVTILGLNLILSAPLRGQKAANEAMEVAKGVDASAYLEAGSMQADIYLLNRESATRSYQLGGAILAAAGSLGVLASCFGCIRILRNVKNVSSFT